MLNQEYEYERQSLSKLIADSQLQMIKSKLKQLVRDRVHSDFKDKVENGLELSLQDLKNLCHINYASYVD